MIWKARMFFYVSIYSHYELTGLNGFFSSGFWSPCKTDDPLLLSTYNLFQIWVWIGAHASRSEKGR